jgi:hypothetical protein
MSAPCWTLMRGFGGCLSVFHGFLPAAQSRICGRGTVAAPIHISAKLVVRNSWDLPITHRKAESHDHRNCRFSWGNGQKSTNGQTRRPDRMPNASIGRKLISQIVAMLTDTKLDFRSKNKITRIGRPDRPAR